MISLMSGAALLGGTALAFWSVLPDGDQVHRLVQSIWGPYVGIGITSGFAIGAVLVISGVLAFFG